MTTTVLIALFIAIVGRFMGDEVKAWVGWLHRKLRRAAVAKLPAECRERYDEERESGLDETPGELFKLIYSIGLLMAATGIRKAALKSVANSEMFSALLKRGIDIVFSTAALILISPLMLAVAIAIRLDSRGPVLYFSERVGKRGRVFRFFKFRTWDLEAGVRRDGTMELSGREGEPFVYSYYPSITRVGRFLRRHSLDELPQLFNVLRGDMSIVGPRPQSPKEIVLKLRHVRSSEVAPGITGLSQVTGRQDSTLPDLTHCDDAYVKDQSIWLDFKIILRTICVVFMGTDSTKGQRKNGHDNQRD